MRSYIIASVAGASLLAGSAVALTMVAPPPPTGERDIAALLKLKAGFADEFEGATLRPLWRTDFRPEAGQRATLAKRTLWSNGEKQVYVAPDYLGLGVQPNKVAGGSLTITARPLTPAQRAAIIAELATLPPRQQTSALRDVAYSSGMISTRGSVAQQYGFFEMRARWTGGRGIWPAFWLLPANGKWPPEIDIMEAHGDKTSTVFQSTHSAVKKAVTKRVLVPGSTNHWHRYGLLWTSTNLRFYVDGHETSRQAPPSDAIGPMYMIANLAIGGKWPGDPNARTKFPATMNIDWVRSYPLPADWTDARLTAIE